VLENIKERPIATGGGRASKEGKKDAGRMKERAFVSLRKSYSGLNEGRQTETRNFYTPLRKSRSETTPSRYGRKNISHVQTK